MKAQVEFQLKQILDILKLRLSKRGIYANCIEPEDPETNVAEARQRVVLKHGIDQDTARKINKAVKESGLKVQSQVQGEKVRVTGKSRDDLQLAIAHPAQGGFWRAATVREFQGLGSHHGCDGAPGSGFPNTPTLRCRCTDCRH